jgi:hypothetical protein
MLILAVDRLLNLLCTRQGSNLQPCDPKSRNFAIRQIHTGTRVILPEEQLDAWLSGEAGKEILVPYPANKMTV